jgi:NitT/TauT family transport system substrate-binding protein
MRPSAAQPSTTRAVHNLRIAVVADVLDYSPFWYAERHGLFDAAGVSVTSTTTYSVPAVTEGLLRGDFDLASTTPDSVLTQPGDQPEQVIVAGVVNRPFLSLVAGPTVTRVEQLRGATLGASSATEGTSILMPEMLARLGVDTADIRIEPVGVGKVRVEALRDGTIDAGLLNVPLGRDADGSELHVLGEVADVIGKYQFITVNARRAWLDHDDHANAVRGLLQALVTALAAVYDPANPEEMASVAAERMQVGIEIGRQGWAEFLRLRPISSDLHVNPVALAKTIEVMRSTGQLAKTSELDLSTLIDESFLPA